MRKIKECICDSTERIEEGILPICLADFLRSMTAILLMDTFQRLKTDNPTASIGGEEFGGKAKTNPSIDDFLDVLIGDDLFRRTGQFMQLNGFIDWFLEQEEPPEIEDDDEDFEMWYTENFLIKKWNEYARTYY